VLDLSELCPPPVILSTFEQSYLSMSEHSKPFIVRRYSTSIVSMLRQSSQEEQPEELTLEAKYNDKGLLISEWKLQHGETSAELHTYAYDPQGRLLLHQLEIPDEGIEEKFVTQRNANGQAVEIQKFYGDDPGERTVYVYGENGEPSAITAYDADGDFDKCEKFTYDDQKRMVKREVKKSDNSETVLEYAYNDQGLLAAVTEKDAKGNLLSRQEHDYTMEGLEARILLFNESGKQITEILSLYDENGRLVSKKSISYYTRIQRYEYDDAGNVVEESLSDENDFVISRTRYDFDDNSRLISETIYETDLTRAGRDTHYSNRYEYEFN
jgi:YD repeat-containing protein